MGAMVKISTIEEFGEFFGDEPQVKQMKDAATEMTAVQIAVDSLGKARRLFDMATLIRYVQTVRE